jgi:hypothetical protein
LINCFKLKTTSEFLSLKKLINISNLGGVSMSKRNECCNGNGMMGGLMGGAFSGNILNLIIFVLIVLQFGTKKGEHDCDEHDDEGIDNSILFIIALFFLFVCSCGSKVDACC